MLWLVFRGDNTTPVFEKTFSPLHNRCAMLLSKLVDEGHEVYWDNLYPSVEVAQTFARGATYSSTIPAGPQAGKSISITVPPTGTCGTARPNRLAGAPCLQPKKVGMSKKRMEELKAQPLEQARRRAVSPHACPAPRADPDHASGVPIGTAAFLRETVSGVLAMHERAPRRCMRLCTTCTPVPADGASLVS